MAAEVDPPDHCSREFNDRGRELPRLSREREHGPMVVGVGVDVEQPSGPTFGRRLRGPDRRRASTLREVRNGE